MFCFVFSLEKNVKTLAKLDYMPVIQMFKISGLELLWMCQANVLPLVIPHLPRIMTVLIWILFHVSLISEDIYTKGVTQSLQLSTLTKHSILHWQLY